VSAQPPTDISLRFADAASSWSKVFLSLTMCTRISVYTSKKRFLWGPRDVGSDSLHGTTVLSLPVAFPMLGSIWARQKILIYQVFNRSVIVRGRQEGLSCIPHLPYLWKSLEGVLPKRFFTYV
jgi:hypothetical protein